jgi:hypothetical protein
MTPATVLAADPDEVVENGSFEYGFDEWTTEETGSVWRPWQVTAAGYGGEFGMATTSPQDGSLVAWNGFAGWGPMEFRLWQDVTIPPGVATLSWMHRIQKFLPLGSDPYTYEVQIRDPNTNSLLHSVYSHTINPSGALQDTGWQPHSEVLPDFAGLTTVRLYFVQYVANKEVGPGQFEIDAVSLLVDPGETNQPPDVSQAYASVDCIWPPNHKMVDINIMGVTDPDNDPITISITSITSDEATALEKGAGGAKYAPDADGIGTGTASVRAERSGDGDGRVYVISFTVSDGVGGMAEGSVEVRVPHDKSKKDCSAIDSGQNYDATLIVYP